MNNLQAILALINGKALATQQGHPDPGLKYIYYDRDDDLIYDNRGDMVSFEPRGISKWRIYRESKSEIAARRVPFCKRPKNFDNQI